MVYNRKAYDSVSHILNAKNGYENNSSSDEERQSYADYAKSYYQTLRDNGYGDLANQLENSDYSSAKKLYENMVMGGKSGKVKTREYLYDLGSKYGKSKSDMDSLISYDNDTGEVSVGGVNIGTPDAEIDGTSYYDPTALDNAFATYVENSGTTPTSEKSSDLAYQNTYKNIDDTIDYIKNNDKSADAIDTIKSNNDNMTKYYEDNVDYTTNYNPYKSSIGKAIMSNYNLQGYNSAQNAKASSAASNAGNIDSYAAANASRQQLAYTNAGTQAVLNDYAQRLNSLWGGFETLGSYYNNEGQNLNNAASNQTAIFDALNDANSLYLAGAQQQKENSETEKDNEISREAAKSEITGTVPQEWMDESNPYLDSSGKLLDSANEVDFSVMLNNCNQKIEEATDETEKASYQRLKNYIIRARNMKIQNDPELMAQYGNTIQAVDPTPTVTVSEAALDRQNAIALAKISAETTNYAIDAEERMNQDNNETTLALPGKEAEASVAEDKGLKENEREDKVLTDAYNESKNDSGTDSDTSTSDSTTSSAKGGDQVKTDTDTNTLSAIDGTNSGVVNYDTAVEDIVNFCENSAKKNGMPEVFVAMSNNDYQVSNANSGYRNWVKSIIIDYCEANNLGQKGLNELLHRFNYIS